MLSYCLFSGLLAYYNFTLIKGGKRIYHGLNGLLHLSAAVLITYHYDWRLGMALLLLTRVVFDTTLNIYRSLGVGYISSDPRSIVDKIEAKVIELMATVVYWKRRYVSYEDLERVAIGFRLLVLSAGVYFLT